LKRAAEDDDANPSETSEIVNRQDNHHLQYAQGIVSHNRFACLAYDENITDDCTRTQQHNQINISTAQTRDTRRKKFAQESDINNETYEQV